MHFRKTSENRLVIFYIQETFTKSHLWEIGSTNYLYYFVICHYIYVIYVSVLQSTCVRSRQNIQYFTRKILLPKELIIVLSSTNFISTRSFHLHVFLSISLDLMNFRIICKKIVH